MIPLAARLLWLAITSLALSFGSYIVVVKSVLQEESGATKPVQFIDLLRPGVHYISGMVTVPSACDELTVHVVQTDEFVFNLKFDTWEEPSIRCSHEPVPRHFSTIAFAPAAGVRFTAQMNNEPFEIIMKQTVITKKAAAALESPQDGRR